MNTCSITESFRSGPSTTTAVRIVDTSSAANIFIPNTKANLDISTCLAICKLKIETKDKSWYPQCSEHQEVHTVFVLVNCSVNKLLQNVKAVYFSKETVVLHWCVGGGGRGVGGCYKMIWCYQLSWWCT